MTIRILVVDDHNLIRTGLCALLNAEPDMEVVGETNNGENAVLLAKNLAPDLVVMDISMEGIGGIEATRRILARQAETRVLILTMHEDKGLLREAIHAGASGYILKRAVQSELVYAIKVVMSGNLYVHPTLARTLFTEIDSSPDENQAEVDPLTSREAEVLGLIARGYTNTQIAQALSISVRTVEFHRSNLMDKLNAHTRVELVRFASAHGYLDQDEMNKH